MSSNKKGFTLIELLAVIVILAIIALISTPIVLGLINDAKKSAAKSSAYGYVDAVEKYITFAGATESADYDTTKLPTGYTGATAVSIEKGDAASDTTGFYTAVATTLKGKEAENGSTITFESGKIKSASLVMDGYTCAYNGQEVTACTK